MGIDRFEGSPVVAQSTLYSLIWVEFGNCTVVVLLRVYSQMLAVRKPLVDDFVMLGVKASVHAF